MNPGGHENLNGPTKSPKENNESQNVRNSSNFLKTIPLLNLWLSIKGFNISLKKCNKVQNCHYFQKILGVIDFF